MKIKFVTNLIQNVNFKSVLEKIGIFHFSNELIKIRVWVLAQVDDCPVILLYALVRKVRFVIKILSISIFYFLFHTIIYSQSVTTDEVKQYRFVIAKTGLTLRTSPDTESEAIDTIPFGKVVEVISELPETVNVQGNISNWFEIKYKWNKGYVVSGYLSETSENPEKKAGKQKDYFGIWKGDWKCGKEFSNLKINKNGKFSGWLFAGGDDSGCGGTPIKGSWNVNLLGEMCLKTNTEESCFFIFNNKLIVNLSSAYGFKENYESEIMSGLTKVK